MNNIETLIALLEAADSAICDGFLGGEWAYYVPEKVSLAAAKERAEALKTQAKIREFLTLLGYRMRYDKSLL